MPDINVIRAWERIGAPDHVVNWLKEGVRLPINRDPGNFQCENRVYSDKAFTFVDKEVQTLLSNGAIIRSNSKPQC